MNLIIYFKDSSLKRVNHVHTVEYCSYDDVLVVVGGLYRENSPLEIFHFHDVVDYVAIVPEVNE